MDAASVTHPCALSDIEATAPYKGNCCVYLFSVESPIRKERTLICSVRLSAMYSVCVQPAEWQPTDTSAKDATTPSSRSPGTFSSSYRQNKSRLKTPFYIFNMVIYNIYHIVIFLNGRGMQRGLFFFFNGYVLMTLCSLK